MEEVNYNDTVVVPFLEKKCKDLLSLNLVLEAKLLIEQNKVKNFENFANNENEKVEGLTNQIENLKLQHSKEIDSIRSQQTNDLVNLKSQLNTVRDEKNNIESERNNLLNQVTSMQSQIAREVSLKDNAISEYSNLNTKYIEMKEQLNIVKNENLIVCSELEQLKEKLANQKSKKQQQSSVA